MLNSNNTVPLVKEWHGWTGESDHSISISIETNKLIDHGFQWDVAHLQKSLPFLRQLSEKWGVQALPPVQHKHTQVYRAKSWAGKSGLGIELSQEDSPNSIKYGILNHAEWKWKTCTNSTVSILKTVITQLLLDVLFTGPQTTSSGAIQYEWVC